MSFNAGTPAHFVLVLFVTACFFVPCFYFGSNYPFSQTPDEIRDSINTPSALETRADELVFEGPGSRSSQGGPEAIWVQKGLPPARSEHAVVYDDEKDKLYLYGGWDLGNELSDLWMYNSVTDRWWDINDGKNPGGRHDHGMILETINSNIYLFGGYDGKNMLSDLWKFDTSVNLWVLINDGKTNSPPARKGFGMIYDGGHNQIIIFGGTNGPTQYNDLWSFDILSNKWLQISASGTNPSSRSNPAMAYNSKNNVIYMFGGFDGTDYLNDFYKLDLNTKSWAAITAASIDNPPSRAEHQIIYYSTGNRIYMFGGIYLTISSVKEYRADFWYYDISTNQWHQPEDGAAPGPRAKHAMTVDDASGEIYIMQGYNGEFREDLWKYRISENKWYTVFDSSPEKSPSIRNGMGLVYDPVGNSLYYFGGYYNDGQPHYREDMWKFQLGNRRWQIVNEGTGPAARFARGVVYDEHHREIYMFGGYYYDFYSGTRNYLNDLWVFNITTDSWKEVNDGTTVPAPRDGHTMIYDPVNKNIYLHGGRKWVSGSIYTYYGDLWMYDVSGKTWTDLTDATTASERSRQAMCYDSRRGDIYVLGGYNDTGYNNEMWKYEIDTGNWSLLSPTGTVPGARGAHDIIYDRNDDEIYLFSGKNQDTPNPNALNDFYMYNVTNKNWAQITLKLGEAPTPRTQYGFVYDHINGKAYLCGGYYYDNGDKFYADLWEYNPDTFIWQPVEVSRPYPEPCIDSRITGFDPSGFYMFGGWDGQRYLDRLWYYDRTVDSFVDVMAGEGPGSTDPWPSARRAHGFSQVENYLYLFGGTNGSYLDDLWRFDTFTKQWQNLTPASSVNPSVRERFAMVYGGSYGGSDKIYLYGGYNGGSLGDLWKFDITQKKWFDLSPTGSKPSARQRHSMTADLVNNYIYLFGGFDTSLNFKNDLWRYDMVLNSWEEIKGMDGTPPTPRDSAGIFVEPGTDCVYVFGGKDAGSSYNDFYRLDMDNSVWIKLESGETVPSERHSFACFTNYQNNSLYLYGGYSGSYKSDLWSWQMPKSGIRDINLSFEDGDIPDNKTCYARYRFYEFNVTVTDSLSYKNIDHVDFGLAGDVKISWYEVNDSFIEYDPDYYIEVSSDSFSENDGVMQQKVHFKIKFNWTYITENYHTPSVLAGNKDNKEMSILNNPGPALFRVETDLEFYGSPRVYAEIQGDISSGILYPSTVWVRGGEKITFENLTVVYKRDYLAQPLVYPPDPEFDVEINTVEGQKWYDNTSSGESIHIETNAYDYSSWGMTFEFNITGYPKFDPTKQFYSLNVDADPIVFSDPSPEKTELNTQTRVSCSINISDMYYPDSSGLSAETIEYSYSTNGGISWSDWKNVDLTGILPQTRVSVEIDFVNGFNNYIRWKADDAVHNGPFVSENYKVVVDTSSSPNAPTSLLLSPVDNYAVTSKKPTFIWDGSDPDGDPITFDLYVGLDEEKVRNRDSTLKKASGLNVPIYTLKDELREGLSYYWTVIPHDELYTGRCLSDVWNFTIRLDASEVPVVTLTGPEDGSILTQKSIALEWNLNYTGSEHVTSFVIVYPDPEFQSINGITKPLVYSDYESSGSWNEDVYNVIPDSILEDNEKYEWTVIPSAGGIVGQCTNGPLGFEINTSYKVIYNITLLAPSEFPVYPGTNSSTSVTVKNTGNVEDIYEIGIASDDFEGNVRIDYDGSDFPLEAGASKKLNLDLTVPPSLKPGIYPVIVTVTSLGSGGTVRESVTINIKVLGEEPVIGPDDKEEGFESWMAALVIVVVVIVIILIIFLGFISKKRKIKGEAPAVPAEATAELSYIPRDAFGSERAAISTYTGEQVVGSPVQTGLPPVATGGPGAAGVVTPAEALPPQTPYEPAAAAVEQPEVPVSPYEGATTETPAEPPTPDGWQPAPQLPPGQTREEAPAGEEVIRYDTIEGPAPEVPEPAEETKGEDSLEQMQTYPPQEPQYTQEQYPPQQYPTPPVQQYIPCTYCGAQNVYGQSNCSYCGGLLNYY